MGKLESPDMHVLGHILEKWEISDSGGQLRRPFPQLYQPAPPGGRQGVANQLGFVVPQLCSGSAVESPSICPQEGVWDVS